jgi:teichuronic acid biosynthesis protein TuaE
MIKYNYTNIVYLLIFTCLIGTQIISIDLKVVQIGPYRLLLMVSPLLLWKMYSKALFEKRIIIKSEYLLFFLFWVIYSLFTVLWSIDYSAWFQSMFFLISGFVSTLLIFSYLDTSEKIVQAIKLVVFQSMVIGVLAFYEMITGNYFFINEVNIEFYQKNSILVGLIGIYIPITLFGNPNNYALFVCVSIIFSILLLRLSVSRVSSFFYFILILFFVLILMAANSRAAILSLIVFFIAHLLYNLSVVKLINKFRIIFYLFIIILLSNFFFGDLFKNLIDLNLIDFSDSSQEGDFIRKNLILNGLYFLYDSYFIGIGAGQVEKYMELYAVYSVLGITNMHNWWLEILTITGLLPFLFYIMVYIRAIIKSYRKSINVIDNKSKIINSVVFCFLISFVVGSIGPSSLLQTEWIWILIAIMLKGSKTSFKY